MYDRGGVSFLLDLNDTVYAYEQKGKVSTTAGSSHDQGMQALYSMNRVQQVEVLTGQ